MLSSRFGWLYDSLAVLQSQRVTMHSRVFLHPARPRAPSRAYLSKGRGGACAKGLVAMERCQTPLRNSFVGRGIVPVQGVYFAASRARGIGRPSRRGVWANQSDASSSGESDSESDGEGRGVAWWQASHRRRARSNASGSSGSTSELAPEQGEHQEHVEPASPAAPIDIPESSPSSDSSAPEAASHNAVGAPDGPASNNISTSPSSRASESDFAGFREVQLKGDSSHEEQSPAPPAEAGVSDEAAAQQTSTTSGLRWWTGAEIRGKEVRYEDAAQEESATTSASEGTCAQRFPGSIRPRVEAVGNGVQDGGEGLPRLSNRHDLQEQGPTVPTGRTSPADSSEAPKTSRPPSTRKVLGQWVGGDDQGGRRTSAKGPASRWWTGREPASLSARAMGDQPGAERAGEFGQGYQPSNRGEAMSDTPEGGSRQEEREEQVEEQQGAAVSNSDPAEAGMAHSGWAEGLPPEGQEPTKADADTEEDRVEVLNAENGARGAMQATASTKGAEGEEAFTHSLPVAEPSPRKEATAPGRDKLLAKGKFAGDEEVQHIIEKAKIRQMSIKECIATQRDEEARARLQELRKRAAASIDRQCSGVVDREVSATGTTRIRWSGGRAGGRSARGEAAASAMGAPAGEDLLQWAWDAHRRDWLSAATRALQVALAALLASTTLAQIWLKPYINKRLPFFNVTLTSMLGRDVAVGPVQWVLPSGVAGVTPLLELTQCSVGPGSAEGSSLEAARVSVWVRPLASLLQRRIVLALTLHAPHLQAVQASNFSWMGFPEDTEPSARPALAAATADPASSKDAAAPGDIFTLPVALENVRVRSGQLDMTTFGDPSPRRMHNVSADVHLWPGYKRVELDVRGDAAPRSRDSFRLTMPTSSKRNLRTAATPAETAARQLAEPRDGGHLHVSASVLAVNTPQQTAQVRVRARNLHAPLLERVLEVPIDMYEGRLDGELRMQLTGREGDFPQFSGTVKCRDSAFHFWDAPDDLRGVNMDMIFQGQRLYLHNAAGSYGAVPLALSGDLDINPEGGEYRLSAQVGGVEVNALRETLGARPTPRSLAGAVRATLHVTGALDHPVFSGTAYAAAGPFAGEPPPGPALDAMARCEEQGAVAAYDVVPFSAGQAVFTLDTASQTLLLHSFHASPVGGGHLTGQGQLWTHPEAELDARAVRVALHARDLPVQDLLRRYQQAAQLELPPTLVAAVMPRGTADADGTLVGSHLAPTFQCAWDVPEEDISGGAKFTREAMELNLRAPAVELAAHLDTKYPPFEAVLRARTQEEASRAATPVVEGAQIDCNLQGVDVLPLLSGDRNDSDPLVKPARLKIHGRTKIRAKLSPDDSQPGPAPAPPASAPTPKPPTKPKSASSRLQPSGTPGPGGRASPGSFLLSSDSAPGRQPNKGGAKAGAGQKGDRTAAEARRAGLRAGNWSHVPAGGIAHPSPNNGYLHGSTPAAEDAAAPPAVLVQPTCLRGEVSLVGLKVNQLSLAPSMQGTLQASPSEGVHLNARGRPDEYLRVSAKPAPPASHEAEAPGPKSTVEAGRSGVVGTVGVGAGEGPASATTREASGDGATVSFQGQPGEILLRAQEAAARVAAEADASGYSASAAAPMTDDEAPSCSPKAEFNLALRRGQMLADLRVSEDRTLVDVANLRLDELELASLRGKVETLHAELDFEQSHGRASVAVAHPRFSGMQGETLSGEATWQGDTVRLERGVFQQARSRYELQGDYVLPPQAPVHTPNTASTGNSSISDRDRTVSVDRRGGAANGVHRGVDGEGCGVSSSEGEMDGQDQASTSGDHREGESGTDPDGVHASQACGEVARLEHPSELRSHPVSETRRVPWTQGGKWRWRVEVPGAEVVEMLPAVRLVAAISGEKQPGDYTRAKALFLDGIKQAGVHAELLSQQLQRKAGLPGVSGVSGGSPMSKKAASSTAAADGAEARSARAEGVGMQAGEGGAEMVPALQNLTGHWRGVVQVAGGGDGSAQNSVPTAAEFDVHGEGWRWGSHQVDSARAEGRYDQEEGLQLQTLHMASGKASLTVAGKLLGPRQDANFELNNFPASRIQPILQGVRGSTPLDLQGKLGASAAKPGVSGGGALSRRAGSTSAKPFSSAPAEPDLLSGELFLQGSVGGSAAQPQCDVSMRLLDGKIGGTALESAEATGAVDAARRCTFNAKFCPAEATGHLKVSGSVPLSTPATSSAMSSTTSATAGAAGGPPGTGLGVDRIKDGGDPDHQIEIDASVKDSGMMLMSAAVPGLRWQQGLADITVNVRGTLDHPVADGVAHVHRAVLASPWLPRPMTGFGATVRLNNNVLSVESLEGHTGRKGKVSVRGALSLANLHGDTWAALVAKAKTAEGIQVKVENLEVRAKNVYSGQLDADLHLRNSLSTPVVSGEVKLSRGMAYLSQDSMAASPMASAKNQQGGEGGAGGPSQSGGGVAGARSTATRALDSVQGGAAQPPAPGAYANQVCFKSMKIKLGPEMRAVYPFVLNFKLSGEVELNGPLDPALLQPAGVVLFESGEINLVATQVHLNREHHNQAVFLPEQGMDPILDISLLGADLRALIQGRASTWQDNMSLQRNLSGEGNADKLTPSEAAQVIEGQLGESILEKDGRLAFSNLAASTINTLLPKMETQGQLGKARWRLVSAPSIPGLLSFDPNSDPFKSITMTTIGTEVEVQFGDKLQATVSRKMKDSEMATNWTFIYQLNRKMRMQLNGSTDATRVFFEFSQKAM